MLNKSKSHLKSGPSGISDRLTPNKLKTRCAVENLDVKMEKKHAGRRSEHKENGHDDHHLKSGSSSGEKRNKDTN